LPFETWEFPIEDSLVVARPDVHGLYILNPSARIIWSLRQTGLCHRELVSTYASEFDIPPDVAQRDVESTLDAWDRSLLLPERIVTSAVSLNEPPPSSTPFFVRDYTVLNKSVRIVLESAELADEIAPRLESLPASQVPPDLVFRVAARSDGFQVLYDGQCLASETGLSEIRVRLLQEVVRICRGSDCLAIFHAGACGTDSECVIFPAGSQSGKTTLAAVLMSEGLNFYADDSVLLERDTLTVPVMPFGLTVREGSWDVLAGRFPKLQEAPVVSRYGQRVRFLPPAETNSSIKGAPVRAIIFVRFDPEARNELTRLDTLEILLRLQQSSFWVAHDKGSIASFLSWLHSTPAFSLDFSDVGEAATMIRRAIEFGNTSKP